MMWLTWRQFRVQAAVMGGALVAIAIVLALTGPHLVHLYDTTVAGCRGNCDSTTRALGGTDRLLQQLGVVVLLLPALVGIFWGAPLVAHELETGSYKLAWTQSVTCTRWLAAKLGVVGLASMASAGLLSLMVTWWSSPLDRVAKNAFSPSYFDRRDLVPLGYAAFAFVLGVVAGILIRRTVPAMAATLVAFIGVRLAVFGWVRSHLMTPLRITTPLRLVPTSGGPAAANLGVAGPSDWVISSQTINGAGHVVGQNGGFGANGSFGADVSPSGTITLSDGQACPNTIHVTHIPTSRNGPAADAFNNLTNHATQICVNRLGIREVLTYQPANRYWPFQMEETALFVGLALLLLGFSVGWIRRRLA